MSGLDSEEQGVLDQIVSANGAWVPLVGLAAIAVNHLLDRGIIVLWCKDSRGHALQDGPFVTLTPLGATIRHVVLMERIEGYPRWVDVKRAERRERNHVPVRGRRWAGVRLMSFPELVEVQDSLDSYMLDDNGQQVYLFDGIPIKIDPRLTRYRAASAKAPNGRFGALLP